MGDHTFSARVLIELEWDFLSKPQQLTPKTKTLKVLVVWLPSCKPVIFQAIINKGEIYTNKAKGDDELPFNLLYKISSQTLVVAEFRHALSPFKYLASLHEMRSQDTSWLKELVSH